MSTDDDIYWHPNTNIKELNTTLGHLDILLLYQLESRLTLNTEIQSKRYTSCGDGELNRARIGKLL